MLNEDAIEKLVKAEVTKQVETQVSEALNDPNWVIDLENQITKFVQDRIVARFSNISTVPDLVATVERSVEKMFDDGLIAILSKDGLRWFSGRYRVTATVVRDMWNLSEHQFKRFSRWVYMNDPFIVFCEEE